MADTVEISRNLFDKLHSRCEWYGNCILGNGPYMDLPCPFAEECHSAAYETVEEE